ncbi:MAG: hypothetical protein ILNGONEN_00201 [Syntrophorhabdaceae bacterium]|nr:hypothetical protein [Syntrophorhabdaceae bacterium]
MKKTLLSLCIAIAASLLSNPTFSQKVGKIYVNRDDNERCSGYVLRRLIREYLNNPSPAKKQQVLDEENWLTENCKGDCCPPPLPCDEEIFDCECFPRTIELRKTETQWAVMLYRWRSDGNNCVPVGEPELLYAVQPPEGETGGKERYFDSFPVFLDKNIPRADLVPFDLNDAYENWMKSQNGDWQGEFRLLVPGVNSDKVWLIQKGRAPIPVNALKASWFDKPQKQQERQMYLLLRQLAICAVNDPKLTILASPDDGLFSFCVAGYPDDKDYLLLFGSPSFPSASSIKLQQPIKLAAGIEATRRFIRSMRDQGYWRDHRIRSLIDNWRKSAGAQVIEAILPADCGRGSTQYNPLALLGNPGSAAQEPPCLVKALPTNCDYLVKWGYEYKVWSVSGKKHKTWYQWNYGAYSNLKTWAGWLAIADTSIVVVAATRNSLVAGKICFISEMDLKTLWSWVAEDKGPPKQHRLLKGEETFVLTGSKQLEYIPTLRHHAKAWERNLFLSYASKPDSFRLLDFFDSDRTLLYQKMQDQRHSQEHLLRAYSIGKGIVPDPPIDFYYVAGQRGNDIAGLQKAYTKWQFRDIIKDSLVAQELVAKEAWFGTGRLGTVINRSAPNEKASLQVFLGPAGRVLKPISFGRVRKLVQKDGKNVYMNPGFNLKTDLFKGCLLEDWRSTGIWRANPLVGYFDRRD